MRDTYTSNAQQEMKWIQGALSATWWIQKATWWIQKLHLVTHSYQFSVLCTSSLLPVFCTMYLSKFSTSFSVNNIGLYKISCWNSRGLMLGQHRRQIHTYNTNTVAKMCALQSPWDWCDTYAPLSGKGMMHFYIWIYNTYLVHYYLSIIFLKNILWTSGALNQHIWIFSHLKLWLKINWTC